MALFERIKFDGLSSREWLIYRHPNEKITLGSTLIVGEGQVAVFVYQGKIADMFAPGAHVLSTANLPILGGFVNLLYGGRTPFSAEIYYVNTTCKMDMFWGTTDPITVIDPKYSVMLHIRAFGQFGVRITDIAVFLRMLIGSLGNTAVRYKSVLEFYKGVLNTKVKTIVSDIIINQKISAFEITPKLEEISKLALERLAPDFAEYGLKVSNFYIQSVNFPDEDTAAIQKILSKNAEFNIMGDQRYATMRSFDVYEGAANNSNGVAGAFAAGGMGFGMGAQMANITHSAMQPVIEQKEVCPSCGQGNTKGVKFCAYCGKPMQMAKVICPKCGTQLMEGVKFCNNCGTSMQKTRCSCGAELAPGVKFCPNCGAKQGG